MSDHSLTDRLRREHARLDGLLRDEARRPSPDFDLMRNLKKRKLALKSRLQAVQSDGPRAA